MHTLFNMKSLFGGLAIAAAGVAQAQQTVPIFGLVELSGTGATSGSNFDNGIKLAVKEINAAGGILGRKINYQSMDPQSNPGVAKALAQKAIDQEAHVVMGPVFSGSIMVSMAETKRAEIPNFTGGEAASITQQGNPYVFRTSFTQSTAMPKIAGYIRDSVKAKTVDVIYVNNDFGMGGLDLIKKELEARGIKVPNTISTDAGQVDCSAAVLKARQSGSDAVAHVGLTADAPQPLIKKFSDAFQAEYKGKSDHNGLKGYSGMYIVKAVTEKVGKFDPKAFAVAMKGISLSVKDHPGMLMDLSFDANGDLDRESFMTKVENGKQVINGILPPVNKK